MNANVRAQLLAAGAKMPKESLPASRVERTPVSTTKEPSQPKEPAEKHVTLPPPPPDCGPWAIKQWTVRRATTYEPTARVVLTGPAAEFDKLLTHLQGFKP